MNTQSGEAPLLFEWKWYQTWTNSYEKFYGRTGGKIYGIVVFSFNVQRGEGRNSITLSVLNFGFTVSWNARRVAKIIEMPNKGPQIELRCFCGEPAKAMAPLCDDCVKLVAK